MDNLLNMILSNHKVKEIINKVSSPAYARLSFNEKLEIYQSFNNVVRNVFKTKLQLNINKKTTRRLRKDTRLYSQYSSIVIDGLEGNPYSYLKDIIISHLLYMYTDDYSAPEIGTVSFIENYIDSQEEFILYSKNNIIILDKVNELMDKLLINIHNPFVSEFKKDFDYLITKEGRKDLIKINELFDKELKLEYYDNLNEIDTKVKNTFILKKKNVSREDLALLSLDQVVFDLIINLHDKNLDVFNTHLNNFVKEFFPEFCNDIIIKGTHHGFNINNHTFVDGECFIDTLFKEIYKIEQARPKITKNDDSGNRDYDKLDSYFYSKLKELDKYLKNRGLEYINYVNWTSIFKDKDNKNPFDDKIDVFDDLANNEQFINLVGAYLKGKKSNIEELKKIMGFLNKTYYNSKFTLTLDNDYGDTSMGSAGDNDIYITIRNNKDKIATLATLFHEFRHLVQKEEEINNHGIYNSAIYELIKYNNKLSEFNIPYSYFEDYEYGYSNSFYYNFQISEYDAEYFSYKMTKAILRKLKISKDYLYYFPNIQINNKYISPPKIAINAYKNFLKMENVNESFSYDSESYKQLMELIVNMKNEVDAIEIFKHDRFTSLEKENKEKCFQIIAGNDIRIKYHDDKFISINDKTYSLEIYEDYSILEQIIFSKAINLIKKGRLKTSEINEYMYKESRKFKTDKYNLFNLSTAYYYHKVFDKYYHGRDNKIEKRHRR